MAEARQNDWDYLSNYEIIGEDYSYVPFIIYEPIESICAV